MTLRHFLTLGDAGQEGIGAILGEAMARKGARSGWPKGKVDADAPLAGVTLAMIFEKNSTRTRLSFDQAIRQLGGNALLLDNATSQLGRGESIADTARVLSRYADVVMIRTDAHEKGEELAAHSTVPVINGLTDLSHPCQILADMQTVAERKGRLAGTKWAWVGDGNNVCNSLIEAASIMDFELAVATPSGFEPDASMVALGSTQSKIYFTSDPREAVDGAEVVVTDTRVSMGQDAEGAYRRRQFEPFRVDDALMGLAAPDSIFLHCLPAHRGEEVTNSVIDGPTSAIWDEAENRLHAQKALLLWVMGKL
jgi:ornithine carbamoyltransferase